MFSFMADRAAALDAVSYTPKEQSRKKNDLKLSDAQACCSGAHVLEQTKWDSTLASALASCGVP